LQVCIDCHVVSNLIGRATAVGGVQLIAIQSIRAVESSLT